MIDKLFPLFAPVSRSMLLYVLGISLTACAGLQTLTFRGDDRSGIIKGQATRLYIIGKGNAPDGREVQIPAGYLVELGREFAQEMRKCKGEPPLPPDEKFVPLAILVPLCRISRSPARGNGCRKCAGGKS